MEEEDCRREIVRKRELYKIKIKLKSGMDKESGEEDGKRSMEGKDK